MTEPIAVEYVAIRPDTKGFKPEAEKQTKDAVLGINSQLAKIGVGLGIAGFLKGGLDELRQQGEVLAQTDARIKATGGAANVTAKQVSDLAEQLQNLSGKDKEGIQAGENLLLTFKSIRNEVGAGNDIFNQATAAALDLSVAGFGSLESTSVQLGKALEDPLTGLTALRRVGVTFTQDQRALIKSLTETGDKLGAQKVLLKAVEDQVGGAAEAYGTTLAGKVERSKNALNDLEAEVVGALAPALEGLVSIAVPLADAFAKIPAPLQTMLVAFVAISAVVKPLTTVFTGASKVASGLGDAVKKGTSAMSEGVSVATRYSSAISGVAAGAAGIAAVAAAWQEYQKTIDDAKAGAQADAQAQKNAALSGSLKDLNVALENNTQQIKYQEDLANNSVSPFDADYRESLRNSTSALVDMGGQLNQVRDQSINLAQATGISTDAAFQFVSQQALAGNTFQSNAAVLDAYTGKLNDNTLSTQDAATVEKSLVDAYNAAQKAQSASLKSTTDLISAQRGSRDAAIAVREAQEEITSSTRGVTEAKSSLIDAEQQLQAIQRRGAADQRDIAGAQLDARTAVLDLADAQKNLADVNKDPKATAEDKQRAQIELERAQLRVASSTDDVSDAQRKAAGRGKELSDAQNRVKDAQDQVRDAQEKQKQSVDDLSDAYLNAASSAATLASATAILNGYQFTAQDNTDAQIAALQQLQGTLDPKSALYQQLQGFITLLQGVVPRSAAVSVTYDSTGKPVTYEEIAAELSSLGVTPDQQIKSFRSRLSNPNDPLAGTPGHAFGGRSNGLSGVAERGRPELFQDDQGHEYLVGKGQVTPARPLSAGVGSRGASVVVNNHIYGSDPRVTAEKATAAAKRATFLHGVST